MIKRACLLCISALSLAAQNCTISTDAYFDMSEIGYNVYLYNTGSNLNGDYIGTTRYPLIVQQNDSAEPNSKIKHIYYLVNDATYAIDAEIHETITLNDCNISDINIISQTAIEHTYSYDGSNASVQYFPNTIDTTEKFTPVEGSNSSTQESADEEKEEMDEESAKTAHIISEIYDNLYLD